MSIDTLVFRVHALKRMADRGISTADVRQVLEIGEIIQRYPDDEPYPSRLVMAWFESRPLHVVAAENEEDHQTIVVTAYRPGAEKWEPDFKRRLGA